MNFFRKQRQLYALKTMQKIVAPTSKSKSDLVGVIIASVEFDNELDCSTWKDKKPEDQKKFLNKIRHIFKLPEITYTNEQAQAATKRIIPHIIQFHGGNAQRTQMILGGLGTYMADEVHKQLKEEIT